MSPLLQGTVALAANKRWLDHIWFFRSMHQLDEFSDFVAELAKHLYVRSYISHERMPIGQLYVLRKGLVVKMWRFLGSGKVRSSPLTLTRSPSSSPSPQPSPSPSPSPLTSHPRPHPGPNPHPHPACFPGSGQVWGEDMINVHD